MPHVVIEEAIDLGLACQGIELAAVRSGSEIFVQLSRKDRQIAVRLLPATDPEKTHLQEYLQASGARAAAAGEGLGVGR